MSTTLNRFLAQRLVAWLVPVLLVGVWEVVCRLHWLPPSESAAPSAIFSHSLSIRLFINAGWTLLRLISGVILGTVFGIASGLFLAQKKMADRLLSPTLQFLAPIPVIVWLPFLIVVFGVGDPMRIAFVATAAYFLVHVHCFHAARSVDRDFIELGQVYEKRYWSRLSQIILPSSSASIFTAVRIALAMGWIVVAFGEFGLQEPGREGIGYFIMHSRALGQVENEFAGILLLGIIGALVDLIVVTLEKHYLMMGEYARRRYLRKTMGHDLRIDIESMAHPRRVETLIRNVSIDVRSGSFVSLVGPSGAGKSTLLRVVAGLEKRFQGRVILDGHLIQGPSREIQLVFQDYRLLPWKTVEENLGFAARDSASAKESRQRVQHWLGKIQLQALGKNWPKNLSGGEEARVAFARAFIDPPKVLLLDEPFVGLDIGRRHELQETLTKLVLAQGTTVILVTHSVDDAVFLGDVVHVASSRPLTIVQTHTVDLPRGNRDRFDPKLQQVAKDVAKQLLQMVPAQQAAQTSAP